jgi:hypothetical protein
MTKYLSLLIGLFLLLSACDKPDYVIADGVWRTEVKKQKSWYDQKKMEEIYNEVSIESEKVSYAHFVNGKVKYKMQGKYIPNQKVFVLTKEGEKDAKEYPVRKESEKEFMLKYDSKAIRFFKK